MCRTPVFIFSEEIKKITWNLRDSTLNLFVLFFMNERMNAEK